MLHHAFTDVTVEEEEVEEGLVLLADGLDDLLRQYPADHRTHRAELSQAQSEGDGTGLVK